VEGTGLEVGVGGEGRMKREGDGGEERRAGAARILSQGDPC